MLVVCVIGHVTDPDAYVDEKGKTIDVNEARAWKAHTQQPSRDWYTSCRHVGNTGYGFYQCNRRVIGPLHTQPELEAAYRLGGERAVMNIFTVRHGGKVE